MVIEDKECAKCGRLARHWSDCSCPRPWDRYNKSAAAKKANEAPEHAVLVVVVEYGTTTAVSYPEVDLLIRAQEHAKARASGTLS